TSARAFGLSKAKIAQHTIAAITGQLSIVLLIKISKKEQVTLTLDLKAEWMGSMPCPPVLSAVCTCAATIPSRPRPVKRESLVRVRRGYRPGYCRTSRHCLD